MLLCNSTPTAGSFLHACHLLLHLMDLLDQHYILLHQSQHLTLKY